MMTREDVLRELELLPQWRLRAPLSVCEVAVTISEKPLSEPEQVTINAPLVASEPQFSSEQQPAEMSERITRVAEIDWSGLQQCVQNCQACSLAQTRKQTVFGVGEVNADWLFVGEAPGTEEDHQGEPFVGQAGKLLDNMLASIQLKRGQNVFITNVLKCHPPENREPQQDETHQCAPYLKRQIELIKPRLIVALGRATAQALLNSSEAVGNLRGRLHYYADVPVIVTYHPAYLLRNLADKAKVWEDLCLAKNTMQGL